jgi:hypothetical protein
MVSHPLLLTHDQIEGFGVEVAIVDLMAARTQSRDDLLTQRRPEAPGDWIRVQNKSAQRRASFVCAGCKRSSLRAIAAVACRHFPAVRDQLTPQPSRPTWFQHKGRGHTSSVL